MNEGKFRTLFGISQEACVVSARHTAGARVVGDDELVVSEVLIGCHRYGNSIPSADLFVKSF